MAQPGGSEARIRTVAFSPAGPPLGTENRPDILDDPDLIPPANPRKLRGHGAAKALYEKGFRYFARKDFKQAIMVYQDFLGRFPGDVYSDNAQFWIGESYFRQKRFAEAEQAYREVLRNYEHRSTLEGYKTPDAIYRIGQTYLKREDPRRARYYFSSAAERFPGTSAGRKAQHELATLILKTAGSGEGAAATRGS
jgi:tol-pal system protein YbgF